MGKRIIKKLYKQIALGDRVVGATRCARFACHYYTHSKVPNMPITLLRLPPHSAKKSKFAHNYIFRIIAGTRRSQVSKDDLSEYEEVEPEPADCDPTDEHAYWISKSRCWSNLSCMGNVVTICGVRVSGDSR